jgi:hypothetical protein
MTLLVFVCLAALLWLLWLLRRNSVSLGLPIAYLYSLLLIHVPGAFAHIVGRDFLLNSDLIEIAMRFTALGSMCFVAGVWLARSSIPKATIHREAERPLFWWFCLIGGWSLIYGLSPLFRIPSVSAAVDKGAGIWMLGVLLGLRAACQRGDLKRIGIWLGALMVYPVLMLLLGGFLSYGSAAIIVVCSALTVSMRSYWRVGIGIAVFAFATETTSVTKYGVEHPLRHESIPSVTRLETLSGLTQPTAST